MKADLVLTMDEYLDQCCALPKPVSPPTREARHVPITLENDLDSGRAAQGYRCDRWGHPCPDALHPATRPSRNAQFLVR
jgi:hypothetical protein